MFSINLLLNNIIQSLINKCKPTHLLCVRLCFIYNTLWFLLRRSQRTVQHLIILYTIRSKMVSIDTNLMKILLHNKLADICILGWFYLICSSINWSDICLIFNSWDINCEKKSIFEAKINTGKIKIEKYFWDFWVYLAVKLLVI